MEKKKRSLYFTPFEWLLLGCSVFFILGSYLLFGGQSPLSLIASLVGAAALLFAAKGNPLGQLLFVGFGILYGIISYSCAYYGEMITYFGMSVPMAAASFVVWLKHPSGTHAEVRVGHLTRRDAVLLPTVTLAATALLCPVLAAFGTANLLPSTVSVATSAAAVYLTLRRSPYFALAYALNDLVLILLWTLAALRDTGYLSVVFCFLMFLANDLYGFVSWRRMERRQRGDIKKEKP